MNPNASCAIFLQALSSMDLMEETQGNQNLSLFSGMTFSSDSNATHSEQPSENQSASNELAEAGLHFNVEETSVESREI